MSYRTCFGKYIDSTDLMACQHKREFLNDDRTLETWLFKYIMHCTEDQCAFSSAVMSTELEVLIEKKKIKCFEKTIIFFNLFIIEKEKLYFNTNGAFYTF